MHSTGSSSLHHAWLSLDDPAPLYLSGDHWWRPVPRDWQGIVERLSHLNLPILKGVLYPKAQWAQVVGSAGPWGHVQEPEVTGCLSHQAPSPLSYPTEWTVDQWYQVAHSAVSLDRSLSVHGLRLKRYCPWDFHFQEGEPVFHNWFQVEQAPAEEAALPAFPSFLRGLVYPLLAYHEFAWEPRMWAAVFPHGISAAALYRTGGFFRRFRQPYLTLVCLPHWMERFTRRRSKPPRSTPSRAKKAVEGLHRQMLQWVKRLKPSVPRAGRMEGGHWQKREEALHRWVGAHRPGRVGDLYCRTGHLAKGVARLGPQVIGLDPDETQVRRADPKGVTFFVMDLACPSVAHAIGQQPLGFVDRYRHYWDMVVVVDRWLHHWRESQGLPCASAFALLHQLTREWVVLEAYAVGQGPDQMGLDSLRALAAPWFTIEDTIPTNKSELWLLKARSLS